MLQRRQRVLVNRLHRRTLRLKTGGAWLKNDVIMQLQRQISAITIISIFLVIDIVIVTQFENIVVDLIEIVIIIV